MNIRRLAALLILSGLEAAFAQSTTTFRYFYDDANELFRVLDSTGTLIEYVYDPSGNIAQIKRSTVAPSALSILNIVPLNALPGQTVTIYGQNFSASAAGDVVKFNGVAATVLSASSIALVVQAPVGVTAGLITVTVNGVTVDSGTLTFAPTPLPSITSIAPAFGSIGQTLAGVVIQGSNLFGATFDLQGGGVVTPVTSSNTQATVNITLGQNPAPFVLLASGSTGVSSGQPTVGNTFFVYNTAGNNYSDMLFSVFNPNGPTPNYPPGTNAAEMTFSVFNATGLAPNYPPGSNQAEMVFSVFNPNGPAPNYPAGTNQSDQLFSVFNPLITSGTTTLVPAGSNQAFQLFSTKNTLGTPAGSMLLSMTRNGQGVRSGTGLNGSWLSSGGGRQPVSLIAGQSVEIAIHPPRFTPFLDVQANGRSIASSANGSISLPLTAPFGIDSFTLTASSFGPAADSLTQAVSVVADPGRTITGRVVDANGSPVAGAEITWEAQGLMAEYYRFGGELNAMPDLKGGALARTSFLGAMNYPNPQQVFGLDPMGVGLGKNYAARLSGRIQIADAGIYQFGLRAHAGASLKIDGRVVAEAVAAGSEAVLATGGLNLAAGVYDIEVTHFEAAGAAALQLLWTTPGGAEAVVPPWAITAGAPASWRIVTGGDGRFVMHVPAALDGVAVKLVNGVGSVQIDE